MDGGSILVAIIKQRFHVDHRSQVARVGGAEVRLADQPWDEEKPDKSSVKFPADACIRKPGTDVIVTGSAVAPGKRKVTSLDVRVRVGPVERRLRVFGLRVWYKG